jgi:hypothetical protein
VTKPGDVIGGRFEITAGPVSTWVLGRDARCKDPQCSGGHYHCAGCGAVTAMTGHATPEDCARARERGLGDEDWVIAAGPEISPSYAELLRRAREPEAELRVIDEHMMMACAGCGCTDEHACAEGCGWVAPGLCSRCAGDVDAAVAGWIRRGAAAIAELLGHAGADAQALEEQLLEQLAAGVHAAQLELRHQEALDPGAALERELQEGVESAVGMVPGESPGRSHTAVHETPAARSTPAPRRIDLCSCGHSSAWHANATEECCASGCGCHAFTGAP